MLRERFFPGFHAAGNHPGRSPRLRWQWVFPLLIVVGLILVLASLLCLMQEQSAGSVPDVSALTAQISVLGN